MWDDYDLVYGGYLKDAQAQVCAFVFDELATWASLATAHFGPDTWTLPKCTANHLNTLGKTQQLWHQAARSLSTTHSLMQFFTFADRRGTKRDWDIPTMLGLLKQHWIPSQRGSDYYTVVRLLNTAGFFGDTLLSQWEEPEWDVVLPADADDRLEQALMHSLAYRSLEDVHKNITAPRHMEDCRTIAEWWDQTTWQLTGLGEDCQAALSSTPWRELGGGFISDPWNIIVKGNYLVYGEPPKVVRWVQLATSKVGRLMMVAWPRVWPVLVFLYVLWRVDKLVFWGPSLNAYKKQHAVARKVKQVRQVATANGLAGSGHSSCFTIASTHRSGGMSVRIIFHNSKPSLLHIILGRTAAAVSHAFAALASSALVANPVVSFVLSQLTQSWWPRACFAVSSYAQLFVAAVLWLVRAVVALVCLPWRLCAAVLRAVGVS